MIYTKMTRLAMKIAYQTHQDQLDKTGIPYIFHPFYLATQMDSEDTTIVALLHDVIEDSDMTLADLKEYGFSDTVLEAVQLLTHEESVPYLDYVRNLKHNPLARKVKRADLLHNSDITRYEFEDVKVLEKYSQALKILDEE